MNLENLRKDLAKKVRNLKPDDDFFLLDEVAKVVEEKNLKPDLADPETFKIIMGSSEKIIQQAANAIWRERAAQRADRQRLVSGGTHCEAEEITLREEVILPSDRRRDETIRLLPEEVSRLEPLGQAIELIRLDILEKCGEAVDRKYGKHTAKVMEFLTLDDKVTPQEISKRLNAPLKTIEKRMAEITTRRKQVQRFMRNFVKMIQAPSWPEFVRRKKQLQNVMRKYRRRK